LERKRRAFCGFNNYCKRRGALERIILRVGYIEKEGFCYREAGRLNQNKMKIRRGGGRVFYFAITHLFREKRGQSRAWP